MTEYIELHAHSTYSLLDGVSSPEALVARAAALDMPALALTDHDAVYGAVFFQEAAHAHGIKPIFGAELTIDHHHLTLLAADATGWHNLCWLITQGRHNADKGYANLPTDHLVGHTDGLIALSGCRKGRVARALLQGDYEAAATAAWDYLTVFGRDRFWLEVQHHRRPEDRYLVADLLALADHVGVGMVTTNNVHYATPDQHRLHDVLVSIRANKPVLDTRQLRYPNHHYYLKSGKEMARLLPSHTLHNSLVIADECQFKLDYGLQDLPVYPTPDGCTTLDYLRQLCWNGLRERIGTVSERVQGQLDYELTVIERAGIANYFLIVWDIVRFAREHGIRCQGRGSAANSLVAYLLYITPIDPLQHNLVFERFLSDERQIAPDIDMDFDAERREEVIQYIYDRYGRDHAAMACTFVTYRRRSAVRDVGKALGLPEYILGELADRVDWYEDVIPDASGLLPGQTAALLREFAADIKDAPRHLGIHNGAMILTGAPLAARVPTEPATMQDRTVVQWDKAALETVGLVKVDILGLRILTALSEALAIIENTSGKRIDLDALDFADPAIYDMIIAGDTVAVFQVESRAQSQMLPRFKPVCFEDLIIAISLIRPGPIQGDMVHPFLRRRQGREPVTYFHKKLERVLGETLGVILYQENVLQVAQALAGFPPGQGELLRRALGSKNAPEAIAAFHDQFIAGALANSVDAPTAELVFTKLQAFGGYSFPKSHAAAFAVLVYQSAWLKHYYPAAFFCGILNAQPMGFWSPAVVVNDVKRHNIPVLPVDVNLSRATCTVENGAIRVGFNYVKGFGEVIRERVVEARGTGPFVSLTDFCQRTQLPHRLVQHLILVGAFDFLGDTRRQLLWDLGTVTYDPLSLDLAFDSIAIDLPKLTDLELRAIEFDLLGISLHEHPLALHRKTLQRRGLLDSRTLQRAPVKHHVGVAGLNVVHQAPPTAKGFHFITLEDEFGFINCIFRPHVYARYRAIVHETPLLIVHGLVERDGAVTNLIVKAVEPMRRFAHNETFKG